MAMFDNVDQRKVYRSEDKSGQNKFCRKEYKLNYIGNCLAIDAAQTTPANSI